MLSLAVPFQGFETVGGRDAQVVQRHGIVEHTQLASRNALDVAGEAMTQVVMGFPPKAVVSLLHAERIITEL